MTYYTNAKSAGISIARVQWTESTPCRSFSQMLLQLSSSSACTRRCSRHGLRCLAASSRSALRGLSRGRLRSWYLRHDSRRQTDSGKRSSSRLSQRSKKLHAAAPQVIDVSRAFILWSRLTYPCQIHCLMVCPRFTTSVDEQLRRASASNWERAPNNTRELAT
jgi:hypothetical protein